MVPDEVRITPNPINESENLISGKKTPTSGNALPVSNSRSGASHQATPEANTYPDNIVPAGSGICSQLPQNRSDNNLSVPVPAAGVGNLSYHNDDSDEEIGEGVADLQPDDATICTPTHPPNAITQRHPSSTSRQSNNPNPNLSQTKKFDWRNKFFNCIEFRPVSTSVWCLQTFLYLWVTLIEKVVVYYILMIEALQRFYEELRTLLTLFVPYKNLEIALVLFIIPFILNCVMFWVIDNILMKGIGVVEFGVKT